MKVPVFLLFCMYRSQGYHLIDVYFCISAILTSGDPESGVSVSLLIWRTALLPSVIYYVWTIVQNALQPEAENIWGHQWILHPSVSLHHHEPGKYCFSKAGKFLWRIVRKWNFCLHFLEKLFATIWYRYCERIWMILSETSVGIRDILVRIRIPGSVPLTNGSGSDSGSDSFLHWL